MRKKDVVIFNTLGYIFITLLAIICLVPFLLVISGSLTKESYIYTNGYNIIPGQFSLEAYATILKTPATVLKAYAVSIILTLSGAVIGLFLTSMTAFVLNIKDFKYRNKISFYFYFTTLFSGGLTPYYILIVRYLNLKDTFWALLLPGLFSVWYLIIMRTFYKSIPDAVFESAKIDGANHLRTYINIALPLSKPALATIGLFIALGYWNSWYNAMLFINNPNLYPLQYYLYKLLNSMEFINSAMRSPRVVIVDLPKESLKMAMAVIATGPIVLLYPFVQKYFIKGMTIGAVKG
jgi:putative aldouronate transport system permease protein